MAALLLMACPGCWSTKEACASLGGFTIAETSSCYMLGETVFSVQDARSYCRTWGGDLVEMNSPDEGVSLAQRIDGTAWLGANDDRQDCAELRADDRWNDVPCTGDVARRALCERP